MLIRCSAMMVVLLLAALPAAAQDLDSFKERIAAAFAAEDKPEELRKLFYLGGADQEILDMYDKRTVPMLARRSPSEIGFEGLRPDFTGVYVQKGYEYRPNLELSGYVVLDGKMRIPYGAHDGEFYFTGMTRTLVSADPLPEVTLQINVFGFSSPPTRYSGSCTIMQSNGKTREYPLEDNGLGNNTMMVNAVRVESCSAEKLSGDGPLHLRIVEDGQTVFEAQQDAVGTPIRYIR